MDGIRRYNILSTQLSLPSFQMPRAPMLIVILSINAIVQRNDNLKSMSEAACGATLSMRIRSKVFVIDRQNWWKKIRYILRIFYRVIFRNWIFFKGASFIPFMHTCFRWPCTLNHHFHFERDIELWHCMHMICQMKEVEKFIIKRFKTTHRVQKIDFLRPWKFSGK